MTPKKKQRNEKKKKTKKRKYDQVSTSRNCFVISFVPLNYFLFSLPVQKKGRQKKKKTKRTTTKTSKVIVIRTYKTLPKHKKNDKAVRTNKQTDWVVEGKGLFNVTKRGTKAIPFGSKFSSRRLEEDVLIQQRKHGLYNDLDKVVCWNSGYWYCCGSSEAEDIHNITEDEEQEDDEFTSNNHHNAFLIAHYDTFLYNQTLKGRERVDKLKKITNQRIKQLLSKEDCPIVAIHCIEDGENGNKTTGR